MNYLEINRNLFDITNDYMLVQCISSDFKLGKGIALEFNKLYSVKNDLNESYPEYYKSFIENRKSDENFGDCLITSRKRQVANLVTKRYYYNKPTLDSIRNSLVILRDYCDNNNIIKLAMPKIGCGLDKLKWEDVSKIIKEIFKDSPVEIVVCYT